MGLLVDYGKKILKLKGRKEDLIDDLPKILVGITLGAYLLKLTILVLFSYQNIKFIEAGMISFMYLRFNDSLKKFRYVYNQIIS